MGYISKYLKAISGLSISQSQENQKLKREVEKLSEDVKELKQVSQYKSKFLVIRGLF